MEDKILNIGELIDGKPSINGEFVWVVCKKKKESIDPKLAKLFSKEITIPNHRYHGPFPAEHSLHFYAETSEPNLKVDQLVELLEEGRVRNKSSAEVAREIRKLLRR